MKNKVHRANSGENNFSWLFPRFSLLFFKTRIKLESLAARVHALNVNAIE